ncbi:MAG: glycogen debranching protein GlgX [Thermodesulfobacteria bacterium]|nr:glycogen debranching protein GlgX [Thermodesulfobacteriota bacterium]
MTYFNIRKGKRYPLGAVCTGSGANFCIFSRHATSMELLIYDSPQALSPLDTITLDPQENRDFYFWNIFVEGVKPGMAYTWKADGPDDTRVSGFRFNKNRQLLDPWARVIFDRFWQREEAKRNVLAQPIRAIVPTCIDDYDWEGVRMPEYPPQEAIIYEMHVRGFTRHPSSQVLHPGTFSAIVDKIPYLKKLGITHIEFLPIMAFDQQDVPEGARKLGLTNYWGYSPHSFFALHPAYLVDPLNPACINEFRDMIKALHKAGIGVILDVVFNHTAEGGEDGPVINFKGLSNREFYHLDPTDRRKYRDFTGCGNTVNCNHPQVMFFIIECLEYWVKYFHIDGFRFDLASVLARGEDGNPMHHAPVIWSLEFSRALSKVHLIAEAWDAGGLYQVGGFPGYRWQEWNGMYRDTVRRFIRGDKGLVGEMATRISGSSDLYGPSGRAPFNSINFVTCHDGFTLMDLVSYERKHNEANGENNRDGSDINYSCNYGVEGPTNDKKILAIRHRQTKNFMATLLVSVGVPMILFGDEVLRTQRGNNNAWCQDNEISWFDWRLLERHHDMLRFTQKMIAFRKRHPSLMRKQFLTGQKLPGRDFPDIAWHGKRLYEPEWHDPESRFLGFTMSGVREGEEDFHVVLNMHEDETFEVELPQISWGRWHLAVDTANIPPDDIIDPQEQKPVEYRYRVRPRSVVIFERR